MRKLQVRILDERIRGMLPHYASAGAAGLDLRACLDAPLTLGPGESQLVSSGIAIHVGSRGCTEDDRLQARRGHQAQLYGAAVRRSLCHRDPVDQVDVVLAIHAANRHEHAFAARRAINAANDNTTRRFSNSRRTRRQPVTGAAADMAGTPSIGSPVITLVGAPNSSSAR